jgi:hypothetical protein
LLWGKEGWRTSQRTYLPADDVPPCERASMGPTVPHTRRVMTLFLKYPPGAEVSATAQAASCLVACHATPIHGVLTIG